MVVVDIDLYRRCRDGKVEEVREALVGGVWGGADPNSTNGHETLLMAAAFGNHEKIVHLLLAQPWIEVNKRGRYNDTALHNACASGSNACLIKLLAVPGVDVNVLNRNNETPIMWAVSSGNTEAVRLMAAVGRVNLDCKFPDGQSLEER